MDGKTVKLRFKSWKHIKVQNDMYNTLKDGEVGEYPEEVAQQMLADTPQMFELVGKETTGVKTETKDQGKVQGAPDKSLHDKGTIKK